MIHKLKIKIIGETVEHVLACFHLLVKHFPLNPAAFRLHTGETRLCLLFTFDLTDKMMQWCSLQACFDSIASPSAQRRNKKQLQKTSAALNSPEFSYTLWKFCLLQNKC